jgi:hypothetical protein
MTKEINYFDKIVYTQYINEFVTITNNPINKVARVEILEHFLQ